jgi:hypothetical protein
MSRNYPPELRRKVLDLLKAGRTVAQVGDMARAAGQSGSR